MTWAQAQEVVRCGGRVSRRKWSARGEGKTCLFNVEADRPMRLYGVVIRPSSGLCKSTPCVADSWEPKREDIEATDWMEYVTMDDLRETPQKRSDPKPEAHLFAEWKDMRWFQCPVERVKDMRLEQPMTICGFRGTVVALAMSGYGHVCLKATEPTG
jgi:hypothetical protein